MPHLSGLTGLAVGFSPGGKMQRMIRTLLALSCVSCAPWVSGPVTTGETPVEAGRQGPQVVATTAILCDLTQQIAGETIALTCLMDPGQDPHVYEPTPADRAAIAAADLILYDGYGASPKLIRLIEASPSAIPRVAVYEAAVPSPRYVSADAHEHDHGEDDHADHGDHADHADHDDHDDHADPHDQAAPPAVAPQADAETRGTVPDPHIWHNARNNGAIATVIATQLAQVVPERAEQYRQAADRLTDEFNALDAWIHTQVATVPAAQRQLLTPHNAFGYFADAYGFQVAGSLQGVTKAAKPSAAHLATLVEQVKQTGIPAIFTESTANPDIMATIAREAGVTVAEPPLLVEGPSGPGTAVTTTQQMLVHNTCAIVNNLGGRCQPPDTVSRGLDPFTEGEVGGENWGKTRPDAGNLPDLHFPDNRLAVLHFPD